MVKFFIAVKQFFLQSDLSSDSDDSYWIILTGAEESPAIFPISVSRAV